MIEYIGILCFFLSGIMVGMALEHKSNERNIRKLVTKWCKDAESFYFKNDETYKLIITYANELESALRGVGGDE